MPEHIYITAHCAISKQQVLKNEQKLFADHEAGLPEFLTAAYKHFELKYPKFYKMDLLSKLGWLATEILLNNDFATENYKPEDVGIVMTNASSSLDADIRYFESVKEIASPALFVYTLPNIVIGEISIKHKFKGENAFFIFEKFDAVFIHQYVDSLFQNQLLQACICGWVEVIGDEYLAVLYLIEKEKNIVDNKAAMLFTTENLNKIYQLHNG
ncbi:hypothetical protein BH11BAC3_BH11BAC3_27430 [soil metagenome]